ncbi:hypothetical protein BGZ73_005261 [Actinomortierella ambigua]|nr:hypothetical protein BGZ73_005261 [Actinomortierella ambigua]
MQLKGVPYRPSDVAFVIRALASFAWSLIRLHVIELPYLIITRFTRPSRQHHPSWLWIFTIVMAIARSVARQGRNISNVRLIGEVLMAPLALSIYLRRHVKVTKSSFKVRRDILLLPERATLSQVRERLATRLPDGKLDPVNPADVYFDSFHPTDAQLANIPEEVGHIDDDGTYTLHGEWIEVMDDPKNPRPRSEVVCLYFHGGGHTFLGPRSHRPWVARLMQKFGPGARAFVLDYRQAPEHPFPAAIHDAFAAYLYMTNPNHKALILNDDSCPDMLDVNPRNIFVAGDSAGGNLTVAFNLYMKNYVQLATDAKFESPFASVAISPWSDMGCTLPSMNADDWHCYCPGPFGSSPFDKEEFMNFKTQHTSFPIDLARNYLCGDATLVPNQRNAFGDEHAWKWYRALAQHPLTSFGHRGNLEGLPDILFHTGSYDRLVDDTRLLAHRVGMANKDKIVRLEVYKDTVHVHHILEHLALATYATKNIVRFVLRVLQARKEREKLLTNSATDAQSADALPSPTKQQHQEQHTQPSSLHSPKIVLVNSEAQPLLADQCLSSSVKGHKDDNVEWILVHLDGREEAKNEGWPIAMLKNCWPSES